MNIWPDCIPCIIKMFLDIALLSIKEEHEVKAFMNEILGLPALRGEEWNVSSPEITQKVWQRMVRITKDEDPLRNIKAEQNRKALDLYGTARDHVRKSADPLLAALTLAIAGNFMHPEDRVDDFQRHHGYDWPVTDEAAEVLRDRLQKATSIVYLLDNCGEIVFDRLFLEVLKEVYEQEVWVIARGRPILNDATTVEAITVGLPTVATVIGNGITIPFAGTRLDLVSSEVRDLLVGADLIIAKGGANLQSLVDERELKGRISFLFHGRCRPRYAPRGVPVGTLIVDNR
jgi:damage-control phosphatase, subfamily I